MDGMEFFLWHYGYILLDCPIQRKSQYLECIKLLPSDFRTLFNNSNGFKKVEVIHSCTRQNPTKCSSVILSIIEKSTDVSAMKPKSRIVAVVVNPCLWFAEFSDLPMYMWTYLTYLKSKVTCGGEWSWTYYTPPSRESNCPTFAKPGKQTYGHLKGF